MKQSNTILLCKIFPQLGAKRTTVTKKTLKEEKFQVFSFAQCLILKDVFKKSYISLKEFEIKAFVCVWTLSLSYLCIFL